MIFSPVISVVVSVRGAQSLGAEGLLKRGGGGHARRRGSDMVIHSLDKIFSQCGMPLAS